MPARTSDFNGAGMEIKKVTLESIDEAEAIYREAREFMKAAGNGSQWGDGYPERHIIARDIEDGNLYKVEDEGNMLAVFFAAEMDEPSYRKIYGGEWKTPSPCGVIHRVAVSDKARGRGVSSFIFTQMAALFGNLRIDTHKRNVPMQRALEKNEFSKCGIIYIKDVRPDSGDDPCELERIAYERLK
jgi:GNAT superfamily N-acetyltransferase